jgi:hypothetical protein
MLTEFRPAPMIDSEVESGTVASQSQFVKFLIQILSSGPTPACLASNLNLLGMIGR